MLFHREIKVKKLRENVKGRRVRVNTVAPCPMGMAVGYGVIEEKNISIDKRDKRTNEISIDRNQFDLIRLD